MTEEQSGAERYGESRVRQILRRAIEIDESAAGTMDATELRQVAAAFGISADALDLALEEARGAERAKKRTIRRLRLVRRILSITAAVIFGLMANLHGIFADPGARTGLMLAGVVPLTVIALTLAVYNRLRGNQRTYQLDNAGIWTGYTLASFSANNKLLGLIPPGALAWLALAVFGYVIIGGSRSEPPGPGGERVADRMLQSLLAGRDMREPA